MKIKILTVTMLMIVTLLSVILLYPCETIFAHEQNSREQRDASIRFQTTHDFVDNVVEVVLSKEATFSGLTFVPCDFPDIGAIEVEDVTRDTMAIVNKQIEAERSGALAILQGMRCSDSMTIPSGVVSMSRMNNYDKIIPFIERNLLFDTYSFRRILRITLEKNCQDNVLETIKILEQMEKVMSACPDYFETISSYDFEPLNIGANWRERIGLTAAHNITTGSKNIVVGVIDSGIDASHPDLHGLVCSELSKDFVGDGHSPLTDPLGAAHGHGTHVAGIIGNNWLGNLNERAVNNNVTLVSLRVFNALPYGQPGAGTAPASRVRDAIIHGTNNAIHILNYSGGGSNNHGPRRRAIANFPGLFVAAAGNNASDNDEIGFYPANHRLDNLISVGATTSADARSSFSNFGSNVDIFAPGSNIRSTIPGGTYVNWNGTSMAAPFIAGTAALMMSINPNIGRENLRRIILENADMITISVPIRDDDGNFIRNENRSVRRLNVHRAVETAATTPGIGRHRTGGNAHLTGEQEFYFIDRFIGYSWNAYIALPDINSMAEKLFPGKYITAATLTFDFTSNRNDPNLRAQVRNTNNPSYLRNAAPIMNLNVNHPTGERSGTATVNVLQHLNTNASSGGIGIISLYDNHNPLWNCGHRVTFSAINLDLQFAYSPIPNAEIINIAPGQFGFINQYHFTESNTSHTFANQFGVNVRRQRTAYNPDENFIVLSSNRYNVCSIHGAFFEFNPVERSIARLEVDLGLWSSAEFNNSLGVEIYLWYRNSNGVWRRHTNLQALNLLLRANARTYTFNFSPGTQGFRISVRVDNPQGTQNRGRIVVGNMRVHSPNPPPLMTGLRLNVTRPIITVNGMNAVVRAISMPQGIEISNANWTVSDLTIVSIVSQTGNSITLRGLQPGVVWVSATYNGFTQQTFITVNPANDNDCPCVGGIFCICWEECTCPGGPNVPIPTPPWLIAPIDEDCCCP